MVKAGHILSVTQHGTLPADRQNNGGHRRLPYATSITASNFFPPRPPCIRGMRYTDVSGETLVLTNLVEVWLEPESTCSG